MSLKDLSALSRRVAAGGVRDFSSTREIYNWVATTSHDLCRQIDSLEASGVERDLIQKAIEPAVIAQSSSPFVKRIQEWPRGYPGDFETIEYLYDGINRAPIDTMGYFFEWFFLSTPPAFQHRNKLQSQAHRIVRTCLERDESSILILAAGGARDLLSVIDVVKKTRARIIINDTDSDALALCLDRFKSISGFKVVPGNAFKNIGVFATEGPFDLIVCGGLFDYIPEPFLKRFLPSLMERLLTKNGSIFFTNIADENPYRTWMEYFGNWKLIERSEQTIRMLVTGRKANYAEIGIARDTTGLTYLVDVRLA